MKRSRLVNTCPPAEPVVFFLFFSINELTFFSFTVFSNEVILDSNQSKNVFTLLYIKRSLEGRQFLYPSTKHLTFAEKDKCSVVLIDRKTY